MRIVYAHTKARCHPFLSSNVKRFVLQRHESVFHFENLFAGRLPSQILLGVLQYGAFEGNRHRNPWNFVPAGLNR
jgi:hypothetical protein